MITLTNPAVINSVLGGSVPVNYDKLIITNMKMDSATKATHAELRLTSTANPDMQQMSGSLQIDVASSALTVSVAQLDFYRRIVLTAAQKTAVSAMVNDAQDSIETGLISLGLISGTHTPAT